MVDPGNELASLISALRLVIVRFLNASNELHFGNLMATGRISKVNSAIRKEIELFWPPAIVVACVLFLWDYILTFRMEVDLVWKSKWNFMKGLYLFQRYLPFTDITCAFLTSQSDVVSHLPVLKKIYRSNGGNSEGNRVLEGILL